MKIYTARHGQTDYNKNDIILGTTDLELNEKGLAQAAELAEKAAALGDIDLIIASPMKRAMKTAQIVAERTGLEIITENRLREWCYGEFEGKSRFIPELQNTKVNFAIKMGKTGESLLKLAHRVYSAIDDIIEKYNDKNVLVVSHGGVCRVIDTYFHEMTAQEFKEWFMGNCELIEYKV